jgi:hypothetical protein
MTVSQSGCRVPRGAHDNILVKLIKTDQCHPSRRGGGGRQEKPRYSRGMAGKGRGDGTEGPGGRARWARGGGWDGMAGSSVNCKD